MYDILTDYDKYMPGEGPFYTMYYYQFKEHRPELGLDNCTWNASYTHLLPHKDELVELFEQHYKFREIVQETEIRFQEFLQKQLDEISEDFDHRFEIYETVDIDELGTGYSETDEFQRTLGETEEAQATTSNNSKFKDTPTSVAGINNPTTETDDEGTSSGNNEHNLTENTNRTHEKKVHDDTMMEEANHLLDRYRSIKIEFIYAFENCFIQLLQ